MRISDFSGGDARSAGFIPQDRVRGARRRQYPTPPCSRSSLRTQVRAPSRPPRGVPPSWRRPRPPGRAAGMPAVPARQKNLRCTPGATPSCRVSTGREALFRQRARFLGRPHEQLTATRLESGTGLRNWNNNLDVPFGQALQKLRDHHAPPNFRQVLECDRPCGAFHIVHPSHNSEMCPRPS